MLTKEEIIKSIENMTVLELIELVQLLEKEFGVSSRSIVQPLLKEIGQIDVIEIPIMEEQTEFKITLVKLGDDKIKTIKLVREITMLGLKEAKEVTENLPKTVKDNLSKNDVEVIKKKFEEIGAVVLVE